MYLALGDKNAAQEAKRQAEQERAREHERQLESLRAVTSAVATREPNAESPAPASVASELERLAALMDRGLLTAEEFGAQKRKLLGG